MLAIRAETKELNVVIGTGRVILLVPVPRIEVETVARHVVLEMCGLVPLCLNDGLS